MKSKEQTDEREEREPAVTLRIGDLRRAIAWQMATADLDSVQFLPRSYEMTVVPGPEEMN